MAFLFGCVLLLELEVEPGPRNGREQAMSGIIRASERNVSCCARGRAMPLGFSRLPKGFLIIAQRFNVG